MFVVICVIKMVLLLKHKKKKHGFITSYTILYTFPIFIYTVFSPTVYASVEPGWLQATYEGRTGLIPENYVVFL